MTGLRSQALRLRLQEPSSPISAAYRGAATYALQRQERRRVQRSTERSPWTIRAGPTDPTVSIKEPLPRMTGVMDERDMSVSDSTTSAAATAAKRPRKP